MVSVLASINTAHQIDNIPSITPTLETPSTTDYATPNLPSRDFAATSAFYAALGFIEAYRNANWMILKRGDVTLEFFPHPDLDPSTSWFSCCLRLDDLDALYALCKSSGLPEAKIGHPRLHAPKTESWGGRMGALIDLDGTMVRLIQNDDL
jgi:hypothetical protein